MTRILRTRWLAAVPFLALLAACGGMSETGRNTAIGAGVGAVAGNVLGGNRTGTAVGAAVGALGGYVWSQRMEQQRRTMQQATQGTGVTVTQTPDNQLKMEVPSDVSFDVGSADIRPNFRPVLDRFAQTLRENPGATVRIVGHTDSTGSDAINNPLSVNRAASTREYLVSHGVDAQRIAIDGRGSTQPIAENTTEAGRARNRRVEIFVGEQQVAQAPAR